MKRFLSYLRNHYAVITKGLLFIVSIIILVLIFPKEGKFKYEFGKHKPWMHENLIAPFDFAILKSTKEVENEKHEVLKDQKYYFKTDVDLIRKQRNTFLEKFNQTWITKYADDPKLVNRKERNRDICLIIYDSILDRGVIEKNKILEGKSSEFQIVVITNNVAEETALGKFFTIQSADRFIQKQIGHYQNIDKKLITSNLENSLIFTIKYDDETTEKEKKLLVDSENAEIQI